MEMEEGTNKPSDKTRERLRKQTEELVRKQTEEIVRFMDRLKEGLSAEEHYEEASKHFKNSMKKNGGK